MDAPNNVISLVFEVKIDIDKYNHSVRQTLDYIDFFYLKGCLDKDFYILDIHNTFSMCQKCYDFAIYLINRFKFNKKTLIVNLSYTVKSGYGTEDRTEVVEIKQKLIKPIFLKVSALESHLKTNEFDSSMNLDLQFIHRTVFSKFGRSNCNQFSREFHETERYYEKIKIARNKIIKSLR